MKPLPDLTSPVAIQHALTVLRRTRLATMVLREDVPDPAAGLAWKKTYPDVGEVYFAFVGWQHANARVQWGETELSMLDVVVHLQRDVWGIPTKNCTSPLDMSIVGDTGGSIMFAYLPEHGLSPEGWLGFVLGYGSRNGVMASRFLAVKDGYRGVGIGSDLKLLQADFALRANHYAMEWTYDPMRSANAYLNLNILGAGVHRYMESKYGEMGAALYGRVPSHRFFVRWHLTDPRTLDFWENRTPVPVAIETLPILDESNYKSRLQEKPPQFRFAIPRDIGKYAAAEPERALAQRATLHEICLQALDAKIPRVAGEVHDPAMVYVETRSGDYMVSAYRLLESAKETGYYIFTRKDML